ncbi:hypothetical protein ACFWXO_37830 [Kitasatospora sp. NPDC059088]
MSAAPMRPDHPRGYGEEAMDSRPLTTMLGRPHRYGEEADEWSSVLLAAR